MYSITMNSNGVKSLAVGLVLIFGAAYSFAQSNDKAARVDALFEKFITSGSPERSGLPNQPDPHIKPGSPGAAVAVIREGLVIFQKGYGLADVESGAAITPATNFRLASFSKQFTAMAILILADRGRLSLDARLTDFFPEFPAYGREITVRHLLNHTSGLADYEGLIPEGTTIPVLDRDALWLLAHQERTNFPPGSRYAYSNSGYAALAMIVERVSGETYAAFQKKNIFDALGMTGTLVNERGVSVITNRAFGHSPRADGGGYERTDHSLTSYVQGDGGVYSSLNDLAKWDAALYTERLVSRGLLDEAFAPGPFPLAGSMTLAVDDATTPTAHGARTYGYGWNIDAYRGKRCVWHGGGTRGFRTMIKRFPEDRFTVIVLTNGVMRTGADIERAARKVVDVYLFE